MMNARKSAAKHARLLKFISLIVAFWAYICRRIVRISYSIFFFGCCARAEKGASILSKIWALINNEILSKFAMPRCRRRATIKSLQPAHNRIRAYLLRAMAIRQKGKNERKKSKFVYAMGFGAFFFCELGLSRFLLEVISSWLWRYGAVVTPHRCVRVVYVRNISNLKRISEVKWIYIFVSFKLRVCCGGGSGRIDYTHFGIRRLIIYSIEVLDGARSNEMLHLTLCGAALNGFSHNAALILFELFFACHFLICFSFISA